MAKSTVSGGPSYPDGKGSKFSTSYEREDGIYVPLLPLQYTAGAVSGYVWTTDGNGNGSWQAATGGGGGLSLTVTSVQTTTYTASANQIVPCDTTSGSFTVTLPNAPAASTLVVVKMVTQGGANTVTVACAGSDVFNKSGGGTTGTLKLASQGMFLEYNGSGIWTVLSDDLPLTQLDLRYLTTRTAVQTSAYNAVPGDFVACDTTSAAFTVTLPTAPADKAIIGVKLATLGGSNAVTIAAGGSDVFNRTSGSTSMTLSRQFQTVALQYQSSTAIWSVLATDPSITVPVPVTQGGTGQTTANAAYNALSPMTTVGDIEYEGAGPVAARLAGNTSATKNFLTQTGSGSASAAPAWGTIAAADLPAATTSAQGAVILDGTGTDIQSTGTQAAGNSTKAAAANHVHFSSGMFLCAPYVYAPTSAVQTLSATGTTLGVFAPSATTVAAGSNGGEISTVASWSSPSAGILDVATTAGWPATGTVNVAASGSTTAVVTYTGTAAGQLTGCAYVSGSATGTVSTGGAVTLTTSAIYTGTFTAPPSGSVVVTVTALINQSTSGDTWAVALAAHGTVSPVIGQVICGNYQSGTLYNMETWVFVVTGLSAASSYNLDLLGGIATGGTGLNLQGYGQTSTAPTGNKGSPVTVTVQGV